jgi:hypothetical protein
LIFTKSNIFKLLSSLTCRADDPEPFEPILERSCRLERSQLFEHFWLKRLWFSPA